MTKLTGKHAWITGGGTGIGAEAAIAFAQSGAGRYATRLTGVGNNATKRAALSLSETINDEEGGNGIRSTEIMRGEVAPDILKTRPVPPAHVCMNEILITPTWNRFYQGFEELG